MLQPRIPLRRLCQNYQPFSITLRRNYAQVVDTVQQSTTITDSPPASSQAPSQLGQSKLGPVRGEQALRRYTPRTPGVRHLIRPINDHIWKGRPLFNLTYPKKGQSRGGRNHTGHVVMRHRGGGHKRRIRTVDFRRDEGGEHLVERIEHDPNRTAHIALVRSIGSGERSYILAAEGMRAGDVVHSYRKGLPQDLLESLGGALDQGIIASKTAHRGNCLKLGMIPIGTPIFNLSLDKKSEAKVCRSAGTHGIIVGKGEDTVQKEMIKVIGDTGALNASQLTAEQLRKFEKAANFVTVRLSSGEVRLFDKNAVATIGMASNANHKYSQLGKAGRKRWLGIRPTVRGLAMNACDHPHGGGRGKSKGNVDPVSPWGRPAKSGYKTRPKNKVNKMVVQERPRNQGKRRRGYA